jgi:hypothetical protein
MYLAQDSSAGWPIQAFSASISSANEFYIQAEYNDRLVSNVNGWDSYAVAHVFVNGQIWVGDPEQLLQLYPLSCGTATPGAGLLSCNNAYGSTMWQYCPDGVYIDTSLKTSCQQLTLTAIPLCVVAPPQPSVAAFTSPTVTCAGPNPTFALQASSGNYNFAHDQQYLAQKGGSEQINAFTSFIQSADQYFLDASQGNQLISDVNGWGVRSSAFTTSGRSIYVEYDSSHNPGSTAATSFPLVCSTTAPGEGGLSCESNGFTIFQLCFDANANFGLGIHNGLDGDCQRLSLSAVPVCVVAPTTITGPTTEAPIIKNGDFESGSLDHWYPLESSITFNIFGVSAPGSFSTSSYTARCYMSFTWDKPILSVIAQDFEVLNGKVYNLDLDLKVNGIPGGCFAFVDLYWSDTTVTQNIIYETSESSEWQSYSESFKAGGASGTLRMGLNCIVGASADIFIDQVSITML